MAGLVGSGGIPITREPCDWGVKGGWTGTLVGVASEGSSHPTGASDLHRAPLRTPSGG